MEHQLHYNERLDYWAWAAFPPNKLRHTVVLDGVRHVPYRPWHDMRGDLAWWEAAQLFGGGN